jgi:hypothetical protein
MGRSLLPGSEPDCVHASVIAIPLTAPVGRNRDTSVAILGIQNAPAPLRLASGHLLRGTRPISVRFTTPSCSRGRSCRDLGSEAPGLAEAAGCSTAFAPDIRRGKWTPRVSTWEALAGLVGMRTESDTGGFGAHRVTRDRYGWFSSPHKPG